MSYAQLALAAVAGAAAGHAVAVTVAVRRGTLPGQFAAATAATAAVLVALTVVFDSAMIAADLFRFDPDGLTGVRLGLAPVEDLAWPVAAALVLPALRAAVAPGPGGPGGPDAS